MLWGKRRKFRLIYQLDMMGCGPSCLAMIMDFYGKRVPYPRTRSVGFLLRRGDSEVGTQAYHQNV